MAFRYIDANILGLAYDGAGILIFGVPAVLRGKADIAKEGGTAWGYNPSTMRMLSEQKLDACAGSILLASGFAFQIIAACEFNFVPIAALLLWITLPLAFFGYLLLRRKFIRAYTDGVIGIVKAQIEAATKSRD